MAAAATSPQEATHKKTAKNPISMLKSLFTSLPTVAQLVEDPNKLLPLISKLLGLG